MLSGVDVPGRSRRAPLLVGCIAGLAIALAVSPTVWRLAVELGWVEGDGKDGLKSFLKVVRRGLLVGLALPIALAFRPWREVPPRAMGLVGLAARPSHAIRTFAWTLLLGIVVLAAQRAVGWIAWRDDLDPLRALLRTGQVMLVPGLLVAIGEEVVFRGWLEGRGDGPQRPIRTALVVGAVYAVLHAFRPRPLLVDVEPTIVGAFTAFGAWIARAFAPMTFGPTFAGLLAFSLVLSAATRRAGSVLPAIGIHAAGITLLHAQEAWIERGAQPPWSGTGRLIDGLPVIALLAAVAWGLEPKRRQPQRGES